MKKHFWKGVIAGMFALLASTPATAITMSFQPSATTVVIGNSVAVDVLATHGVNEIVTAFDFDLRYDPSVIRLTAVSFGNFLGDPNNFEAITDSKLTTAGLGDFAEVSLLTDVGVANLQSASTQFRLATISFDTVGLGTSPLEFINNGVGGNDIKGANNVVLSRTLETGSIGVTSTATVPEPSTLLLLSIGLLGVALLTRLASPNTRSKRPYSL